jgi:peptidoglycan/LPS O-acetylase OafA/YrhL
LVYLRALDGLRGVAILGVLAYHSRLLRGGFVGVDLFFALSGFLITSLLVEEWKKHGDVHLLGFWARRILRLAPALVVTVLLAVGGSSLRGIPLRGSWVAAALLYGSNLVIGYGHVYPLGLLSHTWSLGMEEQFYLVWPLLLVGVARWGMRGVCGAAAVLCIVPAILRFQYEATHAGDPHLWLRVYFAPDMRMDALAMGCLAGGWLGLGAPPGPSATRAIQIAAVVGSLALGAIALVARITTIVATPVLFSVIALSATAIVVGAVRLPSFEWLLSSPPLVWLGKISYGLYLLHMIVFNVLAQPLWLKWLIAIGLAALSRVVVERPFLLLKDRFDRGPPRGLEARQKT